MMIATLFLCGWDLLALGTGNPIALYELLMKNGTGVDVTEQGY